MSFLPLLLDAVFLLFILLSAYLGAARGFARSLLRLCGSALSAFAALCLAKTVGKWVMPIASSIAGGEAVMALENVAPAYLKQISEPVLATLLGFLFSFLAFRIAFWFLTAIICALFRIPILRSFDAFLGGLLGAASALLVAWILAGSASAVLQVYPQHWLNRMNETFFWNLLMHGNVFDLLPQ